VLERAANVPPGTVAPPVPAAGGRIRTGLDCAKIPVGPNTALDLTLETRLSLDEAQLAQEWWSKHHWSSEAAWKMPERVYRLEDIILPILKKSAARRIPRGRVALHVNRV
jgi:hypothetical protein